MALKSRCREIAALLSCKSDDVIDGIKELIAENARLSKEIDEQQLQVEQLRRQVEDLGKANSASKVNCEASHVKSALKENFSGNVDIDSIDPRVLRAYAERRLREQSKSAIAAGHRYPSFRGFLRKEALTVFETLPESVRESSVDEVVQAMKQRLRIDSASSRVKAMAELRSLAMHENQSYFDTIRVAITVDGKLEVIPFFVAKGLDDVIVLGTNALEALGIGLMAKVLHETPSEMREAEKKLHKTNLVEERVGMPPAKTSLVTLTRAGTRKQRKHQRPGHALKLPESEACRSKRLSEESHVQLCRLRHRGFSRTLDVQQQFRAASSHV
ncbi:hypothetical protein Aduo_008270 [Ancylostoma duodenale]